MTRGIAIATLGLLAACGASPAPADRAVAPLAIPSASAVRPVADAPGETRPSPPPDLTLLVRVNDPEQLLREVLAILPSHLAAALRAVTPSQLVATLLGDKLGAVVDLSLPVDVATVGRPKSSNVVSFAVKPDAEATLSDGLTLRERDGLSFVGKGDEDHSAGLRACAFAASSGRTTTRLVCGEDEKVVRQTAKYLARTVARESFAADAQLTVPGRLLRGEQGEHATRDAAVTKALGETASARLVAEMGDRFLGDIDRVDASLRFVKTGVDVAVDVRFTGRESILARALVPRSRPAPPTPLFYRLPADAIVAMHTTGALAEDVAPLREALVGAILGTLTRDGYLPEKVRAIGERIESLLLTGGPLVFGVDLAAGQQGPELALAALAASDRTARDAPKLEAQARAAMAPWVLFALEEPTDRWATGLREVVKRADDADRTRRPGSTSSTPRDPDGDHVDVRVATLDAALRLPKDTLHLEVSMTPRTKGAGRARKGHIFVVRGDDKRASTWVGYSEDASVIAARLRVATDSTTDAGTLAKSPEAVALGTNASVGTGLVAFPGVTHLMSKTRTTEELRSTAASFAGMTRARGGPSESVTFTLASAVDGDGGAGPSRLSLKAHASRALATEMIELVTH